MYTPETVQAVARAMQTDDAPHYAADAAHMLEDYAATLKAAQGGVTEAMDARVLAAFAAIGEWAGPNLTAALKAALSAEPAAQGDGDFKNFHRLLCERFGYVHDPVDWRRDQLSLIEHIARTAPPAQPAERVPLPWPAPFEVVQKWALENGYSGATDDQACAAYRKAHPQPAERVPSRMPYPKLGPEQEACDGYIHECGYADGWNACRDAMLASTAPSEGGKGDDRG